MDRIFEEQLRSKQYEKVMKDIAGSGDRVVVTVFDGDGTWGKTTVVRGSDISVIIGEINGNQQFTVTQVDDQGREVRYLPRLRKL
jgi:hypothetical protein